MDNIRLEPKPYCPECGRVMRLVRPKSGQAWKPFWGCSAFPECDGTLNINFVTGLPVDSDSGDDMGQWWEED